MKKVTTTMIAAGAAAVFGWTGFANGAYTNFGPGFSYNNAAFHQVWTWEQFAMGFTSGKTGNVTDIYFTVSTQGPATVRIFAADDDWTMSTELGAWTLPTSPGVTHIAVTNGPMLHEFGQYWLSITGDISAEAQMNWFHNSTGATGPVMYNFNIVNEAGTLGAFAVVVPAPGALAVMALAGLGAVRRRRREA